MIREHEEQHILNHYRTIRTFTRNGRVIFYGAGLYCRTLLGLLFRFKQPFPDIIMDDNSEESHMLGIPVMKPDDAALQKGDTVLITVDTPRVAGLLMNNTILSRSKAAVIDWNYNFNIFATSHASGCDSELKWHIECFDEMLKRHNGKLPLKDVLQSYYPADLLKMLSQKNILPGKVSEFLEIGTGLFPVLAYAGMLTSPAKVWALDILADKYSEFLASRNITLPVSWLNGKAEDMSSMSKVKEVSFDLIMMDNSLDHVLNPLLVLETCRKKLSKNGIIVIKSHCMEGRRANWTDFHKHDLTIEDNELVHYDFFQTRTRLSSEAGLKCLFSEFYNRQDPFMGKILCFTAVFGRG